MTEGEGANACFSYNHPHSCLEAQKKDGRHEIDLLAELAGGDLITIESKGNAAPPLQMPAI